MMTATVDPIDDRIGAAGQLIMQAAINQLANDCLAGFWGKAVIGNTSVDAALRHRLVHPLDNVAARSEFAQGLLCVTRKCPLSRRNFLRDTKMLQLAEPPHFERMGHIRLNAGIRSHVDQAIALNRACQITVNIGPAFGLNLPFERTADVDFGAGAKLVRNQFARPGTHTLTDIVAGNHKILAVITDPAHDDMDMGMFGVPMIDRRPVELGPHILFHLPHQITGEGFEVRHFKRVIG